MAGALGGLAACRAHAALHSAVADSIARVRGLTTPGYGYTTGCATAHRILSGWQTLVYVVYFCTNIEY